MLFADAQKFALTVAKEIVVSSASQQPIKLTSENAKDVSDFYETIYRRTLALAIEVKP